MVSFRNKFKSVGWTPKNSGLKALLFVSLLMLLTLVIWGGILMFAIMLAPGGITIGTLIIDANAQMLFVGIIVAVMAIVTFYIYNYVIMARLYYTIKDLGK